MKNLLLTLIVSFLTFFSFSQTPVNVYVIHQGCPYGITDTWSSQCGAGNMTLDTVNYMSFQDVYFYQIPDTCYPIQLTMCVYVGATQPPFPQQIPFCLTQTINGGGAITLLADCSQLSIEEQQVEKTIVSIKNLIGQPINKTTNEIMFVTWSDGTIEKVFIVE